MKEWMKNKIRNLILYEINNNEKINKFENYKLECDNLKIEIENLKNEKENFIQDISLINQNLKTEKENFIQDTSLINQNLEVVSNNILEIGNKIDDLQKLSYADEDDFKALYKLLLKREPEKRDIVKNSVKRKDLFNNIVFSEEFNNINKKEYDNEDLENYSFSQVGEDRIIFFMMKIMNLEYRKLTYLDLGANHPKEINNTYLWYILGGQGVLVEANPTLCFELEKERTRDVVLNKFISNNDGDTIEFYILNGDGLSCGSKESVDEFIMINPELKIIDKIEVESISIMTILDKYFNNKAPDIINIDIEGMELEILKAIDFQRYRAKIIICEMIPYDTKLILNNKNKEILEFMENKGYVEYAFTGVNSIFIDKFLI